MKRSRAQLLGEVNKRSVLSALRASEVASVDELVRATRLSQPTVLKWLSVLEADNFITRHGFGESTGGRPPLLYRFNADAGRVLGVEVEIPAVRIGVLDLNGRLLHSRRWSLEPHAPPAEILRAIVGQTVTYTRDLALDRETLMACGLVISGFIDPERGLSVSTPRLRNWHNVPLRATVQEALGVPVYFASQIDALALAEVAYGVARETPDFLYVDVSHGLGVRMVSGGRPVHGSSGNAGLLGHMTVVPNGRLCLCGNRGCLETYASERALVAAARRALGEEVEAASRPDPGESRTDEATSGGAAASTDETTSGGRETADPTTSAGPGLSSGSGSLPFEEILRRGLEGDPRLYPVVDEFLEYLSIGLANLVNVLGVTKIVVGGSLAGTDARLLDRLTKKTQAHLQPILAQSAEIRLSTVPRHVAGCGGAGVLALEQELAAPQPFGLRRRPPARAREARMSSQE